MWPDCPATRRAECFSNETACTTRLSGDFAAKSLITFKKRGCRRRENRFRCERIHSQEWRASIYTVQKHRPSAHFQYRDAPRAPFSTDHTSGQSSALKKFEMTFRKILECRNGKRLAESSRPRDKNPFDLPLRHLGMHLPNSASLILSFIGKHRSFTPPSCND